eukprot:g78188.t1
MEKQDKSNFERLQSWQRLVFISTFTNYALAHWTRKCYTNVKIQFMQAGVTNVTLAGMDSAFMLTYAMGSFVTGMLGDRFSAVVVISLGLLGSSLCLLSFLVGVETSIATSAMCGTWFVTTQALHGLFQATGGPVNTAIMGSWFGKKNRGFIFGLWTCHQYTGDIIAAFAGAWILRSSLSWHYAIIIPLVVNAAWGFINLIFVPNRPGDVGVVKVDEPGTATSEEIAAVASSSTPSPPPISICQAFMIPSVMNYAIAFGFFKLINYSMFFQLPLILTGNFTPAKANLISSLYSFGMMPGGVVCGWLSDLYGGRRAAVCATMMICLIPLLFLFAYYLPVMPVYLTLVLLCIMGCLVGGPNNIITSAVAADLSEDPSIRGNNRALGTVTGIINGSGSVTAALGQMVIPYLTAAGKHDGVGFRYVWLFLVLCVLCGTALLSPKIIKELKPTREESQPLVRGGGSYQSTEPERQ